MMLVCVHVHVCVRVIQVGDACACMHIRVYDLGWWGGVRVA